MKNKKIQILTFMFVFIVLFLVLIYIIWDNIEKKYVKVYWNSMYPTLKNNELYEIEKVNNIKTLVKDDIVVFNIYWTDIKYIKRLKILANDKFELSYENNWSTLILTINNEFKLKFNNYRNTKFYNTLLLWSNNTNKWWVKAPQCWVFWDNISNSVDTFEYWFIWCNKITHKIIK